MIVMATRRARASLRSTILQKTTSLQKRTTPSRATKMTMTRKAARPARGLVLTPSSLKTRKAARPARGLVLTLKTSLNNSPLTSHNNSPLTATHKRILPLTHVFHHCLLSHKLLCFIDVTPFIFGTPAVTCVKHFIPPPPGDHTPHSTA